jgi:hypothetical protein
MGRFPLDSHRFVLRFEVERSPSLKPYSRPIAPFPFSFVCNAHAREWNGGAMNPAKGSSVSLEHRRNLQQGVPRYPGQRIAGPDLANRVP